MPNLTNNFINLVFTLLSAGLLAFCGFLCNEIKKYRDLLSKKEMQEVQNIVNKTLDEKLEKVLSEIGELRTYIDEVAAKEETLQLRTISAWGYRIKQLCELYMEKGFMTYPEYLQLVEMYNLYSSLGGNGKVKEIFEKTTQSLEIRSEEK